MNSSSGRQAVIVFALAVLLIAATPAQSRVRGNRIFPGQGACGVRLDMTRDEVIDRMGKPVEQVGRIMGYSRHLATLMFDVYFDAQSPQRVRMLGISGKRFRVDGIRVFRRGGLRKLIKHYGPALKPVTLETGDPIYRLTSSYQGLEAWTDFGVIRHSPDSEVLAVMMLFPDRPA